MRAFKYISPLIIYLTSVYSFSTYGWLCFTPLIHAWIVIPTLELFLKPNAANLSEAEEEIARNDRNYDYILYMIVILQIPTLFYYLYSMQDTALSLADKIGRTGTMGLLCGTFGINVGHELGHRIRKDEQTLAKISLLSSLYMHFFIEHNKGHHKNVATPADPSSARYGESVFGFWFRSIVYSYISAWHIASEEAKKKHAFNEMVLFQLIQIAFVATIWLVFGWQILLWYLAAALMGILLLETVNYIEHYGLQRKATREGKYERAMPAHSWNSNHVIGRVVLFELSRHSDHHYLASRKYQLLRHHDDAPQMPTGYPGMMILSLFPPLWFYVMNPRVKSTGIKKGLHDLSVQSA